MRAPCYSALLCGNGLSLEKKIGTFHSAMQCVAANVCDMAGMEQLEPIHGSPVLRTNLPAPDHRRSRMIIGRFIFSYTSLRSTYGAQRVMALRFIYTPSLQASASVMASLAVDTDECVCVCVCVSNTLLQKVSPLVRSRCQHIPSARGKRCWCGKVKTNMER